MGGVGGGRNRQSGGDKGLNVQGQDVFLPALASAMLHLLNRPLKNRPPGKTTTPSINHSNYKAEKEKQGKKRRGADDRRTK